MNIYNILTLLKTPKISRKTVKKIIGTAVSEPTTLRELHELIELAQQRHSRVHLPDPNELEQASKEADKLITQANEMNILVIGFNDQNFPQKLKRIPDPPVLLYVKGNLECLNRKPSIAVIGTRHPSPYGQRKAEEFGCELAKKGIAVISGLALGCDTGAHIGCLNAKGTTIAVLANGLDTVYPAQNRQLATQIVKNEGCLISEYPPGTRIMSSYFVDRDRIQSGLSDAVIVVETDLEGGTMHTVNFCLKQERLLACLDHEEKFENNKSRGNKHLISTGKAVPIRTQEDIEGLLSRITLSLQHNTPQIKVLEKDDKGKQFGTAQSSAQIDIFNILEGEM